MRRLTLLVYRCLDAGPACPNSQPSPTLLLDDTACGDLPPLFNHDPIRLDAGRPPGCMARLPYGNPFYAYTQQTCICTSAPTNVVGAPDAPPAPEWQCPL